VPLFPTLPRERGGSICLPPCGGGRAAKRPGRGGVPSMKVERRAAQQPDRLPVLQGGSGVALDVLDDAQGTDDRRWQDGFALGLVVERHVAADDRDVESEARVADAVHNAVQGPPDQVALGITKIQAVGERDRASPRACYVP